MSYSLRYAACSLALVAASASGAFAHAIVGDRAFPATLAVDDPGISDEINLPQISRFKAPDEDTGIATGTTAVSVGMAKRLTENLGVELGGTWLNADDAQGFDNFEAGAKYVFYRNAPHEIMLSTGIDWDMGSTGAKRVGAESFSGITPALFFGKGMGDLPDSLELLKPLALTGSLGYSMPTRSTSNETGTGDIERNAQAVEWGLTVQYSVPYLQQHVRDIGLPAPLGTAVPVVEFAFETPTGGPDSGHTTGTINPGIIFMGQQTQLGLEAQLPLNGDSGEGVGYIVQLHFYLDNLFPQSIGKPIW